jgi:hypothetical protein
MLIKDDSTAFWHGSSCPFYGALAKSRTLVWSDIHTYTSLTFGVTLLIHLILNQRPFLTLVKRISKPRRTEN